MATNEMVTSSERAQNTVVSSAMSGSYIRPLAILTALFFLWGFITSLNDILVPHLKSIADFDYTKVMLIQFAFFSAYFLFSYPWSKIVNKIGYQKTMVVGLVTMSVGALLFVPAASIPSFPPLLTGLMILAAGITGLQVAANPYVLVLGNCRRGHHSGASGCDCGPYWDPSRVPAARGLLPVHLVLRGQRLKAKQRTLRNRSRKRGEGDGSCC